VLPSLRSHSWRGPMPISITGRHIEVDEALEGYIRKKLPRFEKYTDKLQKVEIVLEKDAYNCKAEMRLKAGRTEVHANVKDPDVMAAIDLLADKVEAQMQKKWGKLRNKKSTAESPRKQIAREALRSEPDPAREPAPAKMPRKRAGKGGDGRSLPRLLKSINVRIFPSRRIDTTPMSIEKAAEELFFSDENFLCFVNEEDRQLNVLYRRKDGNFGLIEPVWK
jgi:putative sigma-54 modulation protein